MPMNFLPQPIVLLNTRPLVQAKLLAQKLASSGGKSVEFPLLDISELAPDWVTRVNPLPQYHCAIFISQHAVDAVFRHLSAKNFELPCVAIGAATKARLIQHGITQVSAPKIAESKYLLAMDEFTNVKNKHILLFKGTGGRRLIIDSLQKKCARISAIDVYRREKLSYTLPQCREVWQNKSINVTLFTSAASLHHAFDLFEPAGQQWLKTTPCIVLSERLKHCAQVKGIEHITVASANSLINSLTR